MSYYIERLRKICGSTLDYVKQKKGVLDQKGIADLEAMDVRIEKLAEEREAAMGAVADAETDLTKTTDILRDAVLRSRRILEAASVGNPSAPKVPKARPGMYAAKAIHTTAVEHYDAIERLPEDMASRDASSKLKTAMAAQEKAFAKSKGLSDAWQGTKKEQEAEFATLGGKLWAYRTFVAYNLPAFDRKDLRVRLRYVAPEKQSRSKNETTVTAVTAVAQGAGSQPVTIPALPAVPPGSGEHPRLSANA
ncbi:MAG: hypothetical protein HY897_10225 [Deltaproteobacteria bacterium]|nr:hypothetical protein [Deltaproteobacteria bacterium]